MDKKINISPTDFGGLFVMKPNSFSDDRGMFSRLYCEEEISGVADVSIKQVNHSVTMERGTVRGLHFQHEPNAEIKMVRCIRGAVFDVVVDVRRGSPTFLKRFSVELTEKNGKMIFIPKGFAHGFQTLEDKTELLYFHSSIYAPLNEGALNVRDPLLGIEWPLDIIGLSGRDSKHAFLNSDFNGVDINEL